jgi:small subunit ribosomal protein S4
VTVNDKVVNIPSYSLRPGDVVAIREKSKSLELISSSIANRERQYSWLDVNDTKMEGKFIQFPLRDEIPEKINEQLIVELYSK